VFASIAGTWRGGGHGSYPTIDDFEYTEEIVILPVPDRPVAHWRSTTRDVASGEPRHAESGFLRSVDGGVELVLAHGFGVVEAAAGSLDGADLAVVATAVVGTASAKRVDAVERRYAFDGDVLRYEIAMAAVGVPMTHHLRAELARA
jgi:hypothetical protein